MGEHGCCKTDTEEKGHCKSEGGCGCGHGHDHEHEKKPLTKEEKISMLKEYLGSLEQEVKGVSEKIKELESE